MSKESRLEDTLICVLGYLMGKEGRSETVYMIAKSLKRNGSECDYVDELCKESDMRPQRAVV